MNTKKGFHSTVQLDPTYFLLGTLSDFEGRVTYVSQKSEIDRYYPYEKPLVDYIYIKVKNELKIDIVTAPDTLPCNLSIIKTFSPELSLIINSYFDKTYLIIDRLKNKPNLNYSYLTGRFFRFGWRINDSIYSIHLVNSADHKVCDSLLRRVGCNKIHFILLKNIPAQFIYYFIPTPDLKAYFYYISKYKKKLNASYFKYLKTGMKISKKELKKGIPTNPKEYSEIIELFK